MLSKHQISLSNRVKRVQILIGLRNMQPVEYKKVIFHNKMPNWRVNTHEGLYNSGVAYPLQKKVTRFWQTMQFVKVLQ